MITVLALSATTKTQVLTGAYKIISVVFLGSTAGTANIWDSSSTTVTNSVGDYDKKTRTVGAGALTNVADISPEGITYEHVYSGLTVANATQAAQANKAMTVIAGLPVGATTVNEVNLYTLFGLVAEASAACTIVVEYESAATA